MLPRAPPRKPHAPFFCPQQARRLAEECGSHGLKKGGGRFELVLRLVSAGLGECEDELVEV